MNQPLKFADYRFDQHRGHTKKHEILLRTEPLVILLCPYVVNTFLLLVFIPKLHIWPTARQSHLSQSQITTVLTIFIHALNLIQAVQVLRPMLGIARLVKSKNSSPEPVLWHHPSDCIPAFATQPASRSRLYMRTFDYFRTKTGILDE